MPKRFSKSGAVTCKAQRENVAQPSWLHPVHAMRPDSALPLKRFVGADGVRPSSLVGNIDATNTNTAPTWTNKPGALRPVESQQVVTNSATQYINVSDEISPARRTYNPSTSAAGDTEAIAAKGRLVLVNGATPALAASLAVNPSELFSQRNMTYNENSIALPSDRGTLEISGANLMYEGARVKSWMLGRDVNPAGRGDGAYYAQGAFSIGSVRPSPTTTPVGGWGNSVNNPDWIGPTIPHDPCQDLFAYCPFIFSCDYSMACSPAEWERNSADCCTRLRNVTDWCHPNCINTNNLLSCMLKHNCDSVQSESLKIYQRCVEDIMRERQKQACFCSCDRAEAQLVYLNGLPYCWRPSSGIEGDYWPAPCAPTADTAAEFETCLAKYSEQYIGKEMERVCGIRP